MRFVRPRHSRCLALAVALLGSLGLGACSSVPTQVDAAAYLAIAYFDFKTDSVMILASESDPDLAGLYSRPRDDAHTKLAPDEMLRELVDSAGANGFFDNAGTLTGPDEAVRESAHRMIVITADERSYSFVLEEGLGRRDPDAVLAFTAIQEEIRTAYNSIHQLQYLRSDGEGGDYFQREQERLRRENQGRARQGGDR